MNMQIVKIGFEQTIRSTLFFMTKRESVSVIPDKQAALKMQPEAEKFIIIGCLTAWVLCCCGWK